MSVAALVVRPTPGDGIVDIAGFDEAWCQAVDEPAKAESPVAVDLGGSNYLDQECLLYLVSVMKHRSEENLDTHLLLPQVPTRVVEFLADWEFSDAVWAATRRGLDEFLEGTDEELQLRLKSGQRRFVQATPTDSSDSGREGLLPVEFFAIRALSLGSEHGTESTDQPDRSTQLQQALAIASEARDLWLAEHLVAVLDHYLNGYGDRIATDIFYEGVLNAAAQRDATLVLTSSQMFNRSHRQRPSEIVVTIWDNGSASFGDTLRQAWKCQQNIVSPAYGLIDECFRFTVSDLATAEESTTILRSTDTLGPATADDDQLMLWPFMGGTTSRPATADSGDAPVNDPLGLGLHIMKSAVIDLFGGSLMYATGRHRLTLQRFDDDENGVPSDMADYNGKYDATLKHLTEAYPVVAGNLLVARLPCV